MSITKQIETIRDRLASKRQHLAVAESLTGGRIQSLITSVSGVSTVFAGGITAYSVDQKVKHLKINREHAKGCNAVSAQVAEEMAIGASQMFDVEWSVATTGYAEAEPSRNVDTPFAFISVFHQAKVRHCVTVRLEFHGILRDRKTAQEFFAEAAVGRLHRFVKNNAT